MKHLGVLLAVVCLLFPLPSTGAEPSGKIHRVGYLSPGSPPSFAAFWEGLRAQGFMLDQDVKAEYRWAEGKVGRLPGLAAELVALDVEAIFAWGFVATVAAREATHSIPIVFATHVDPVEAHLVHSLARPGGNLTGLTFIAPDLAGKRLEMLKEMLPDLTTVSTLVNTSNPGLGSVIANLTSAADRLGVKLNVLEVRQPRELDTALVAAAAMRGAVHVNMDPFLVQNRQRIVSIAERERIPVLYDIRSFVDAGGLFSFGPRLQDQIRHAGEYVGRILKGAKASDLPVQQPERLELIINLKAAGALGLTIPPSLLARADEVIE